LSSLGSKKDGKCPACRRKHAIDPLSIEIEEKGCKEDGLSKNLFIDLGCAHKFLVRITLRSL
jgi:hypothetical protein